MMTFSYVDIEIRGSVPPVSASIVMRMLHQGFCAEAGQYALALPDFPRSFPRLRVFACSRDALDRLAFQLGNLTGFSNYGRLAYPKVVEPGFTGRWRSYRRYRIPVRGAERHTDGNVRGRRILAADELELPYFSVASRSTRQRFRLYVQALDSIPSDEYLPDGYGLASAHRSFALPVVA